MFWVCAVKKFTLLEKLCEHLVQILIKQNYPISLICSQCKVQNNENIEALDPIRRLAAELRARFAAAALVGGAQFFAPAGEKGGDQLSASIYHHYRTRPID